MKITTKEELEQHIKNHKGQDVPLFVAIGMHGFIIDETLKSYFKIEIETNPTTDSEFIYLDGMAMHSLMDRHLEEQEYNDNWWFTTKEEAQEYVNSKLS